MEPTEAFQPRLRALAKGNTVREITAPRGSVIFFHGRLAHSAGENRLPGTVRMAAFCDFQKEQEILDVPPVDGIVPQGGRGGGVGAVRCGAAPAHSVLGRYPRTSGREAPSSR